MFEHLFKTEEELEKHTPKERASYQYNLKYYRDLKNVTDTARDEGRAEWRREREIEGEIIGELKGLKKVAKRMKIANKPIEEIMEMTSLSKVEIEAL